jgi:hypothetical protein
MQCNCSTCNVPPDAGLQKRATFSTLIVGLARTGDRTRATCGAGSGNNHSAIHYDSYNLKSIFHKKKRKKTVIIFKFPSLSAVSDLLQLPPYWSYKFQNRVYWKKGRALFLDVPGLCYVQKETWHYCPHKHSSLIDSAETKTVAHPKSPGTLNGAVNDTSFRLGKALLFAPKYDCCCWWRAQGWPVDYLNISKHGKKEKKTNRAIWPFDPWGSDVSESSSEPSTHETKQFM